MKLRPPDRQTLEYRLKTDQVLLEINHHVAPLECWIVGGWIRDLAVNRVPPDVDLVVHGVDSAEKAARSLATYWAATPRLLGKPEKAVWRVTSPRHKVELWPLDSDDLESDAHRRDFSCNALFWRLPDGPLFDPEEGLKDIAERRIRAISKANLAADPVRLLRAVRLKATLDGFSIDPKTRRWIVELAPTLAEAPRERVGAELLALARAPQPTEGFREAGELGLLGPAAPQPANTASAHQSPLQVLASLSGKQSHPVPAAIAGHRTEAILAWLVSGWPTGSGRDLTSFAWPRRVVQSVETAAARYKEALGVVEHGAADRREFIARCGQDFPTVLALAAAYDSTHSQSWKRWWRQWERGRHSILAPPRLLDSAEIVATLSIEAGPRLGRILADLTRATIRREVRTSNGARRWLKGAHRTPTASSDRPNGPEK